MRHSCSVALCILAALLLCFLAAPAHAVRVEPDPEVHRVLGTLYALATAINLHRSVSEGLPEPVHLERYLRADSLPEGWPDSVRIAESSGSWWVGIPVPAYSTARKYLRANASELGVHDGAGGIPWMGGSLAWIAAVRPDPSGKGARPFGVRIAEGWDEDKSALFFGTPSTDRFWWSPLLLSDSARSTALKRWGRASAPELRIPRAQAEERETFKASPVGLPEEFGVSADREPGPSMEMGDVILNPIPRPRSN